MGSQKSRTHLSDQITTTKFAYLYHSEQNDEKIRIMNVESINIGLAKKFIWGLPKLLQKPT